MNAPHEADEPLDPCEAQEIALERRLAGRLPPDEEAVLEEHLAGCDGCRRYARQMTRIRALVRAADDGLPRRRPVSGERVRRQIEANRNVARYSMIMILILGFGIVVDGFDETRGPRWLGLAAMVLGATTIAAMAHDSRSMRRLAESPDDILSLSCSEVRTRISFVRALSLAMAVLGVLALGTAPPERLAWLPSLGTSTHGATYFWLGLALLGASLASVFKILPRLRRELEEYECTQE